MRISLAISWLVVLTTVCPTCGDEPAGKIDDLKFGMMDVFQLEWASDPQISADGTRVVYVRNFMDIMKDQQRSNLWIVASDGSGHRPLTTGNRNDWSPRWSPDGTRLIYLSKSGESTQVFCRWMDTGDTAQLTNLTSAPSELVWSRDSRQIAFSMLVEAQPAPFVKLPEKPEGAEWAPPAKVIRTTKYRADGKGYLKEGFHQLFVLSAEGGTPRQLTSGEFNHEGPPSWSRDGQGLFFSANRRQHAELDPVNTEIFEVGLSDRKILAMTDRNGPDFHPIVSPDGTRIAYLGFDDRYQGYQLDRLYVMDRDGGAKRLLSADFDRDVQAPAWSGSGEEILFQYDDQGVTKVGACSLSGEVRELADHVGGVSIGRPYASGSFSASRDGIVAFTFSRPNRPADIGIALGDGKILRLTDLNRDLLAHKSLAEVESISFSSAFDKRRIQGWIAKPPGFDAGKKYPLILEIHGGPFANYGPRFSAEIQLYAAAGYVVLYVNPRGSTSYGQEFGNLIHHEYPGRDYDDLMSGVDQVVSRGYIDADQLYVTGGSGGGVLTSWIVGKTDRFRAAVAAKPVINWHSFVLTSDAYPFFTKYWFPGYPWERPEEYLRRSPLSLVGNVKTPTMLLTGEVDYRTPISESEQFYQALKLRRVDTALVRVPGASHGIAARPSRLISKVAHILQWFESHKEDAKN